jgi:hypothetical protein
MSYPSINRHLEAKRIPLETGSDAELAQAFIAAFREDLPLGMARVDELVAKLDVAGSRAMLTLDPNSDEGKQFARLLGPDIPRSVLEDHYGVAFGFYNCCKGVTARKRDDLKMTLREQIEAQHPNFVDC